MVWQLIVEKFEISFIYSLQNYTLPEIAYRS